jgi:hypothetical protein
MNPKHQNSNLSCMHPNIITQTLRRVAAEQNAKCDSKAVVIDSSTVALTWVA